jgi:hypothetical protein
MSGFLKSASIAVFSLLALGTVGNAQTVPVHTGATYDGWKIFFPEHEGVSLIQDTSTNTLQLVLEKSATFTSTNGFLITFAQDSSVSAPATTIEIANESITNTSGVTWSGFAFSLLTPFAGPNFQAGRTFAPPPGYTTPTVSAGLITYPGTQADSTTSLWNQNPATDTGNLVINTDPLTGGSLQSFSFKEVPLTGATVPVPAALWTSLTGLLGLAVVGNRKSLKKMIFA